ncbi:MAG: carbohydrate porin [Thermoguttaceae bacterium]|nr:carbohydrate porin [Thermoguttaceae bacterium]
MAARVAILGNVVLLGAVGASWGVALPTVRGAEVSLGDTEYYDSVDEAGLDDAPRPEGASEVAEDALNAKWEETTNTLEINALGYETHELHGERVGGVSAFRQLIDKTKFGATITTVGQHSSFGASDSGIDGSLMVELKAKAELTERDTVRATFKAGMGEGLGERIPSFCGLNAASGAGRNVYLNQLWYERKFGDGNRWRARVGYLDLTSDFDANAYANDEYCQFLSDAFVNNLTFECAANSLGGQIWWEPNDKWRVGAGYAESDRDCREMFSNGVAIFEVDRRVDFGGLQGTYRGYVTANFGPREALDGSDDDLINDGWGLSFDQEISRNVGLWGRYGQQNGKCNEFDRALTAGFELHSFSEERPDDALGFGYGIMFVSDDFKELNENSVDENHFELYYSFQVNKYFSATPSLQRIDGAGGDGEAKVVWAPGLRATVAF